MKVKHETTESETTNNVNQTRHEHCSLNSLKRKSWWWRFMICKLPLQNSFYQKQHLQDTKNQLLSASSCLCVDMRARYLNRSAMRMYKFCYFLFLASEILKMIKRNFTYGFDWQFNAYMVVTSRKEVPVRDLY